MTPPSVPLFKHLPLLLGVVISQTKCISASKQHDSTASGYVPNPHRPGSR